MALPDPVIWRQDDRLTIRLPARRTPGWAWVGGMLFSLPFFAGGGFMATAFAAPQWLGITKPAPFENKVVGCIIAVITLLLVGSIVLNCLIVRFGHSEIVLSHGRIRCIERVGFVSLKTSRPLAMLMRLDIVGPPFEEKSTREPRKDLETYFSDAMPYRIARGYPPETLKLVAKELLGAISRFGGPQKVTFAAPPPLSAFKPTPVAAVPPQRWGELKRISVEHRRSAVKVAIAPFSWPIAAIPLAIAMVAIAYAIYSTPKTWTINTGQNAPVPWIIAFVALSGGTMATLGLRTRHQFHADRDGLRANRQWPLGSSVRRWQAADIDRISVETHTHSGGKGGTRTVHALELRLKNGKRQVLLGNRSMAELGWMRDTLAAALNRDVGDSVKPVSTASVSAGNAKPPRAFGWICVAFASIFFVAGWTLAIKQDLRLRQGVPVSATVDPLKTVQVHGRHGDNFITTLHYRYQVAGRPYGSDSVFPVNMTGPTENSIRERLLATIGGQRTVTAWYDSGDPSTSYLVHERMFGPYIFIFVAMLFASIGLGIAFSPREPKGAAPGTMPPLEANRRRIVALFWTLSGALAFTHYLIQWPTTWHVDAPIVAAIWLIVSIILLNWWRLGERLADASRQTLR